MNYVILGVVCVVATLFYALSVGGSFRTAVVSGALGGIGYIVYLLLDNSLSEAGAVFAATLLVCLLAETLARLFKAPATVFAIPAILPLVPGLMLYQTMLRFGAGDTTGGMSCAVEALIVAGSMSLAVTLATALAKLTFKFKHKKQALPETKDGNRAGGSNQLPS